MSADCLFICSIVANLEIEGYQGCFYEDGSDACEKEIHVRINLDVVTFLHFSGVSIFSKHTKQTTLNEFHYF